MCVHIWLFPVVYYCYIVVRDSSVGIATDYGLDGPRSNPGGKEFFPTVQTGPVSHPASCTMGTGSFPGVKCGRGVLLTTHPLLVPQSWKSTAIVNLLAPELFFLILAHPVYKM